MSNFEQYILDYFNTVRDCKIKEAMLYCMEGGKRFRPRIIFSLLKIGLWSLIISTILNISYSMFTSNINKSKSHL